MGAYKKPVKGLIECNNVQDKLGPLVLYINKEKNIFI